MVQSWLTGRRQKVRLNNEFSDWCDVSSEVPQGSVLGPLLFLIYINGIDEYIVSKLEKFADDTKLCRGISNNNNTGIFRSDLNQIYQWSLDWQMLFNIARCRVVHLAYNNKEYDYKLGCDVIRSLAIEKD